MGPGKPGCRGVPGPSRLGIPVFCLEQSLAGSIERVAPVMRFAVWQMARYLLLVLAAVMLALGSRPIEDFGMISLAAEVPLSIALILELSPQVGRPTLTAGMEWFRRHLDFACRGLLGSILMELNLRLDIIMLGIFASDAMVGIYSLAAMVAEAFLELFGIVRTIVNPILVPMLKKQQFMAINAFARTVQRRLYPASLGIATLIAVTFPFAVSSLFGKDNAFAQSWSPLLLLLLGITAVSGFIPFHALLMQAGRPGSQTVLVLITVATNITLNAILIPNFGMLGAATATALTLGLSTIYLNIATKLVLGYSLGWPLFASDGRH